MGLGYILRRFCIKGEFLLVIDASVISYNLEKMVDVMGMDVFVEVCKIYGGESVYFPTYGSLNRYSRDLEICSRYDGSNASQLAKEFGISKPHVSRIVCKMKK